MTNANPILHGISIIYFNKPHKNITQNYNPRKNKQNGWWIIHS